MSLNEQMSNAHHSKCAKETNNLESCRLDDLFREFSEFEKEFEEVEKRLEKESENAKRLIITAPEAIISPNAPQPSPNRSNLSQRVESRPSSLHRNAATSGSKGKLQWMLLKVGMQCYVGAPVSKFDVVPYRLAEVIAVATEVYTVRYLDGYDYDIFEEIQLPLTRIAFASQLSPQCGLTEGFRVLARLNGNLYPGTVAQKATPANRSEYLVFFDSGAVRYASFDAVFPMAAQGCVRDPSTAGRLLAPREAWRLIPHNCSQVKEMVRNYLQKYPEWELITVRQPGLHIVVEKDGDYHKAVVLELDRQLVRLRFPDGSTEWIYRGSHRIKYLKTRAMHQSVPEYQHRRAARRTTLVESAGALDTSSSSQTRPQIARKSSTQRHANEDVSSDEERVGVRGRRQQTTRRKEFVIFESPIPPPPQPLLWHLKCDRRCALDRSIDPNDASYKGKSIFLIPLLQGWQRQLGNLTRSFGKPRERIIYVAPCGKRICSETHLGIYLRQTDSLLSVDLFSFDTKLRPRNVAVCTEKPIEDDNSYGEENIAISVVNVVDDELTPEVVYTSRRFPAPGVQLPSGGEFCSGCTCVGDCSNAELCACQKLTRDTANRMDPEIRPTLKGFRNGRLQQNIQSGVYECNKNCSCVVNRCVNRVVQRPLKTPLQLFKTASKGWGVRSLVDIPVGQFICIYAGAVLTDELADKQGTEDGDEYFAELDLVAAIMREKEDYIGLNDNEDAGIVVNEELANEELPRRRPADDNGSSSDSNYDSGESDDDGGGIKRVAAIAPVEDVASAACSVSVDSNSVVDSQSAVTDESDDVNPSSTEGTIQMARTRRFSYHTYFGEGNSSYVIDAKRKGNIGRYFNHSCDPNVFVQHVFVDTHDLRLPWVSFFAAKRIQAGDELCWDYRYEIGSVNNKRIDCRCGATCCKGRLL